MKLTHPIWLALCLSVPLAGGGCGEEATHPQPAPLDNTTRLPAAPGEPTSLVRITDDHGYQIDRIRLTGNYLYFATDVLYRMPKYGGELTVVDTNAYSADLAANREHVFSIRYRSDWQLEVSQYSALGVPEGTFPINPTSSMPFSLESTDFFATDEALYIWASLTKTSAAPVVLTRYPFDGSAPNVLEPASEWVVDADRLYYSRCAVDDANPSCVLESVPLTGGAPTTVAAIPGPRRWVVAVDAGAAYLASPKDIVRVAKSDGALTTLFTVSAQEGLSMRMVVDERRLYCVVFGGSVPRVMAVPKNGVDTTVEIGHSLGLGHVFHAPEQQILGYILSFEQDEHNLFILPNSSEIFMFPKDPS